MKLLAMDQATAKTGYAIFNNNQLEDYGLIDHSRKNTEARIPAMYKSIMELIEKTAPDKLVFEDVMMQSNVASVIKLGRLQGVILGQCCRQDVPNTVIHPREWRKVLGFTQGRGVSSAELKQQAITEVQHRYGIKAQNDVAEAICIGTAFLEGDYE